MDSSMYNLWVQQDEQRPNDRTAHQQQPSDLPDFSSLPETTLSGNPQPFYFAPNYLFQGSYATTLPYGTPWPTTTVPLSNYSSLNGATTVSSTPQQQSQQPQQQQQQQNPQTQQQHSPQLPQAQTSQQSPQLNQQQPSQPLPSSTNHMIIDPTLGMNGTTFPQAPSYVSQAQQQMQAQGRQQYYSQMLYPQQFYRQQPPNAPQGTLSPQALHSPTMMTISPTFYGHPHQLTGTPPIASTSQQPPQQQSQQQQQPAESSTTPAPGPTPEEREERKRKFVNSLRPLLQTPAFGGAQAVRELTDRILDYGVAEVDAATRLDILGRIRDGAGNHYYRAWSENANAVDITREWIKAAAKGNNAQLVETIMPLLHLIDRLPFGVDTMARSKLGKIIKKLVKDEPSPAIKDMATNIEKSWRKLLASMEGNVQATENNAPEDAKTKKRKLSEPVTAKTAQPIKKAAVGTAVSNKPTVAVKREPGSASSSSVAGSSKGGSSSSSAAAPAKDAKADSSFFSAPKPKPKAKLPSFQKKPVAPAPAAAPNTQASFNPFQDLLKDMKRKDSPSAPTPPPMSGTSSGSTSTAGMFESQPGLARNGRPKKYVTWAPDGKLEAIRFIEKAIYDDDPVDGTHVGHSLRDLDRSEGAALHAHLFEEAIDWSEPLLIELPPADPDQSPRIVRGSASQEKATQEEREQTALSAVYMSPGQIPESPAEPTNVISEEEVDKNVKVMTVGNLDTLFQWGFPDQGAVPPSAASVQELVQQLAMGSIMDATGNGAPHGAPMDMAGQANAALAAVQGLLPQDQLQALLQQLSSTATAAAAAAAPPAQQATFGQSPYGGAAAATDNGSWAQHTTAAAPSAYDYSHIGYHEDSAGDQQRGWSMDGGRGRGRGFRGRGRGRGEEGGYRPYIKRKPCSFFAAGRCKYGDQCDFAHDLSMLPEH